MSLYSYEQARREAKWLLPGLVFDYIDGAAGSGVSHAGNRAAFDRIAFKNRVLAGVEALPQEYEVLGQTCQLPFGISPMAMCRLARFDADDIMAEWAKYYNAPLGVSTSSSTDLETMWQKSGGKTWFQLYHGGDMDQTWGLVKRAASCGYQVLILTVDVPSMGYRPRELRAGFTTPFKIGPKQFLHFASRPNWSIPTLLKGAPTFANFNRNNPFDRDSSRAGADWDFLKTLREFWQGKLVIKGVSDPQDAEQIKSLGADAVMVSNHGGRQLQSSVASIDCLPELRRAVGDTYPVFLDSGIASGEDIIKAYALGADFVFIGRLALYSIAARGKRGLDAITTMLNTTTYSGLTQLGIAGLYEAHPALLHRR